MINLHLTRSEFESYLDQLEAERQRRRVQIGIHNATGRMIDTVQEPESVIMNGAIQVDCTAAVTRSLSLTLSDPRRKLRFDSGTPARGAVYADRMLSVVHGIYVPALDDWVDVPTFFGPVTGYSQDGQEVTLEAQGKESLMLEPHFATEGYSIKKNTTITKAIREVATRAGEDKFDLQEWDHKIKADKVIRPQDEPWKVLAGGTRDASTGASKGLVGWGDTERIAFYDGRGKLVARRMEKNAVYTFGGDVLTSAPSYTFDMLEFRNHVRLTGATPKGKGKQPIKISRSLPANHPLSPDSLKRNGVPRYLTTFVNAPNIKKEEDAIERANDVLERRATTGLDVSFECLPILHLEEGDKVRVTDDKTSVDFPLVQFTLPLLVDQPMTVGANRQINQRAPAHRRRPVWFRG